MSIDPAALPSPSEPSRPTTPSRSASDPARQAWQREMERAQTESWFRKQADPQAGSLPCANPARHPEVVSDGKTESRAVTPPLPVFTWAPAPQAASPHTASPSIRDAFKSPMAAQVGAAAAGGNAEAGQPVPAPAASNSRLAINRLSVGPVSGQAPVKVDIDGVATPVRVHLAWEDGVARVWVGADAAHAEHLPRVAGMVIRWLAGQGVRVASLTCNGEPWPVDIAFFNSRRPDSDAVIHITETTREF